MLFKDGELQFLKQFQAGHVSTLADKPGRVQGIPTSARTLMIMDNT